MHAVRESLVLSLLGGLLVLSVSAIVHNQTFGLGFCFALGWSCLNILLIKSLTDRAVLFEKSKRLKLLGLLFLKLPVLYGLAVAGLALEWATPGVFALGFSTPLVLLLIVTVRKTRREVPSRGAACPTVAGEEI